MSIRIRVYPQPGSIGARRNRARRLRQQAINRQIALQQQQMLQPSFGFGGVGGFAHGFGNAGLGYANGYGYGSTGYGSNFGASWSTPYGSSWGRFPGFGAIGASYSGAYALPSYGGYSSYYSPVSVAQYGARAFC
jgi:hypothetical protein